MPFYRSLHLLLFVSILAGCTAVPAPQPPAQHAAPATALPGQAGPAPAGRVTISFGAFEARRFAYAPLIAQFNHDNPDLRVVFVALDALLAQERPDFTADFSSGSTVLAQSADTFAPGIWIGNAYRYDLAPLLAADATFDPGDFYPAARAALEPVNGPLYHVPATIGVTVLQYNRDLFTELNLPPPNATWGWSDIRAAAEQVAKRGLPGSQRYGLLLSTLGSTALAGELSVRTPTLATAAFAPEQLTQPASAEALAAVRHLAQSGAMYAPPAGDLDANELSRLVAAGRVAMWDSSLILPLDPAPFAVGAVPLPAIPDPFLSGTANYTISAGTQHPEAAWRWIAFLSRHDWPTEPNGTTASIPARQSVTREIDFFKPYPPDMVAALQVTLARPPIPPAALATLALRLAGPLQQVLGGEAIDTVLREAQATAMRDLAASAAPVATATPPVLIVATPLPDLPLPAAGATTLIFGDYGGDPDTIQRLARAFMQANPEIAITLDATPADQLDLKNAAARSDCFRWPALRPQDDATVVLDLQPLIDADRTFQPEDYPAHLLVPLQRDGRLAGLPAGFNAPLLAYSRARFDAAGLAYPQPDWSLTNLLQTAQQLTQRAGNTPTFGYAIVQQHTRDLRLFLDLAGASPVRQHDGRLEPGYTDALVIATLRLYLELLRSSSPYTRLGDYARNQPATDGSEPVRSGQVGVWFVDGPVDARTYGTAFAAVPRATSNRMDAHLAISGWYIAARSPYAAACWQWLSYLSREIVATTDTFPARRSVAMSAAFGRAAAPGLGAAYMAYQRLLDARPSTTRTVPVSSEHIDDFWFFRAVDRALQGKDLERELQVAQTLTEQYLACARSGGERAACAKQVDPQYQGWALP